MRRITLWMIITATVVVLLFSYHTSTNGNSAVASVAAVASPSAADAATSTASPDSTASTSQSSAASPAQPAVFTGEAVDTKFGPVQVQIAVANGQVTEAVTIQVPENNGKDRQINSRAVPVLEQEAIHAQSADIDMVSGATYTSDGYVQSLQSALDQANLG
ncbi:FMN-binding protein [Rhodococcus sp. OK302]|uniref:FMN-binding protein n=1 Tax=Rhodococcus sp. OK302 TaxID=1882769 RepID=UPI000B944F79|nr:FMN-binding protein [Rhodococcus sp. OK302]OYD67633.1 uncharacterized protein with FMN-binding domain [Rhodococcus sp. OK302]